MCTGGPYTPKISDKNRTFPFPLVSVFVVEKDTFVLFVCGPSCWIYHDVSRVPNHSFPHDDAREGLIHMLLVDSH